MPRAQLTPDEVESMRNRLSAAALEIFRAEGLEAVSFRKLADAEGISHTHPYRYFDNKDALLAWMRAQALGHFEGYVRDSEADTREPLPRVWAVAEAYIRFSREHPAEYLLIFATPQPGPGKHPELLRARRSLFDHAVGVLQCCVDHGLLEGDARQLAHEIWVGLHGLMMLHAAGQFVHGMTMDELLEPLMHRLLGVKPLPQERPGANAARRMRRGAATSR